jgi:hypothetical protein
MANNKMDLEEDCKVKIESKCGFFGNKNDCCLLQNRKFVDYQSNVLANSPQGS